MLKTLKTTIPLFIFIIIGIFLWRGINRNPSDIPSPLIGKPVPTFKGAVLSNPKAFITNKYFTGQVTLFNVFATWCMSCRAEHPVLMDIRESHRVNIVGLDYKDKRSKALQWLKQEGNPYTVVVSDPNGAIGIDFGVYGTPETFVIDRHGIIRDKYVGAISPDVWKNKLLPEVKRLETDR